MILDLWWLPIVPAAVAAIVDIRLRRLPNVIVIPALLASLSFAVYGGHIAVALAGAVLAAAVGLAIRVAARGGFGLGDVKLLAYGGSIVGITGLTTFLTGTAIGGGVLGALYLGSRGRQASVPYGVAITLGLALAVGLSD
ncbi:MAG: hypothetical protein EPO65_10320 [Dehalococcoidia bacterium]|nr:MAG: hypothetical protein EPO65_10320 [Dehalococcoidia bacterium]